MRLDPPFSLKPPTTPASPSVTSAPPPVPLSVLYLGPESGTSLHRRNAFMRLGHQVHTVDPRRLLPRSPWIDRFEWHASPELLGKVVERRLESALAGRYFDIAFIDGGSLLTGRALDGLRRHCTRLIAFNHDNPYGRRDWTRFSAFRAALPAYDLVIAKSPPTVVAARDLGAKRVMHHPCNADEVAHAPRPLTDALRQRWASEVAFIGTWMPERGPFMLELIRQGVPLTIYGSQWRKAPEWAELQRYHVGDHLDGDDYALAVQCARVSLCLLSKGNGDLHTTRSMEIPSLGGLLCAERTDQHQSFYREGAEAVFWSDAEECARLCRNLLADEPARQAIVSNGRRRFLANGYTSENLIKKAIAEVTP